MNSPLMNTYQGLIQLFSGRLTPDRLQELVNQLQNIFFNPLWCTDAIAVFTKLNFYFQNLVIQTGVDTMHILLCLSPTDNLSAWQLQFQKIVFPHLMNHVDMIQFNGVTNHGFSI